MRDGFTLVEILVVLAIMGIVATVSFINFGAFKEEENLKSTASDLQSYLRLAQSNAQTGVKCDSSGAADWSIIITDRTSIKLRCQTEEDLKREWTIKPPAQIDSIEGISGSTSCPSSFTSEATTYLPITMTFSYLDAKATFSDADPANECLAGSNAMSIKIRKKVDSMDIKTITISKVGSINVE